MMISSFVYRLQARRPATYLAFGAGLVTAYAVGMLHAAAAWPFVLAYLGVVLWKLLCNSTSGLQFLPGLLTVYHRGEERSFRTHDIAAVRLRAGVIGEDECVLEMASGERIVLPPDALPRIACLRAEFRRCGIALR